MNNQSAFVFRSAFVPARPNAIERKKISLDNLDYNYQVNGTGTDLTNKLYRVTDGSNDAQTKLGDFKDGTNVNDDYTYDANGTLSLDENKAISSISYNHRNLPQIVTLNGKGTISYTYDATGNKLKKVTVDNTVTPVKTTTTLYLFGIYENDVLQFLPQEEGRIRPLRDAGANITGFTYDYFLKDHLGNVRMVLTEEVQSDQYPALSFEGTSGSSQVIEQKIWEDRTGAEMDIIANRTEKPGFGASGNNSMLVRKSTGAIGAGKLLKVMSGDRIHTAVDYYYQCTSCNSSNANGLSSLTTSLLTALAGSGGATEFTKGNAGSITSGLSNNPDIISFFNPETPGGGNTPAPKAYLHVLLFDEQFKFDQNGSYVQQIGTVTTGTLSKLAGNAAGVKKNGYAYIYFSNESEEFVYFDNFMLTHEKGPLLEETHYYPFGLTMAGISALKAFE